MNKLVYIYDDEGCLGVDKIESCINKYLPNAEVKKINADAIIGGVLEKTPPVAFFMGGGKSRYYKNKLGRDGIRQIRKYANKKDSLSFFICAGAYFASSVTDFINDKGGFKERIFHCIEKGQLALFSGIAKGYFDESNRIGSLKQVTYRGKFAYPYYLMGPGLENLSAQDEVMAKFEDDSPAIIKTGKNKNVVVSSVHFEPSLDDLNSIDSSVDQKNQDDFVKLILTDLIKKMRPFFKSGTKAKMVACENYRNFLPL